MCTPSLRHRGAHGQQAKEEDPKTVQTLGQKATTPQTQEALLDPTSKGLGPRKFWGLRVNKCFFWFGFLMFTKKVLGLKVTVSILFGSWRPPLPTTEWRYWFPTYSIHVLSGVSQANLLGMIFGHCSNLRSKPGTKPTGHRIHTKMIVIPHSNRSGWHGLCKDHFPNTKQVLNSTSSP